MKNIEKLIERVKGNKAALVVPKELFDMAIVYFNDDYFTEFVHMGYLKNCFLPEVIYYRIQCNFHHCC